MKKSLIACLAALCLAAVLPQTLSAGIGFKGGLSLAKCAIEPVDSVPFPIQNLTGPVGGVFFGAGLGPLSFQTEILYARMGMKGEYSGATIEYRADYIQVPLLLKVRVIPAGPVRPIVYAGGYGSYLLKAKGIMTSPTASDSEDITDTFQRYDYGVVGGAGLEFKLPGIMLSLEGRYNYGLANIIKDPGESDSAKNRSMMVLVGIGF
ncbi:MAG: porin family protein [Acidobacteriota bacterium]